MSSIGKIHGSGNQEIEIGMAQITCFPSFLVIYSGKFYLLFPQLWVLQVYRGKGKSPIELFLPMLLLSRDQLARREITILVGILIQIQRDRAILRHGT